MKGWSKGCTDAEVEWGEVKGTGPKKNVGNEGRATRTGGAASERGAKERRGNGNRHWKSEQSVM